MNILSLHDGHNASAALFKNDTLVCAISEERINRKKFYWGFPHESISYVLAAGKLELADIDVVTVSHLDMRGYIARRKELNALWSWYPKRLMGNLINVYQSWKHERAARELFKDVDRKPVFHFVDHHYAHALSAYYYSGFDDALVVTFDGLGDSLSHTAYSVEGGTWKKLVQGDTSESLGLFYAAVTEGLGFIPNRHEGKVVGLAAHGNAQELREKWEHFFITRSEDALHFTRAPYKAMVDKIKDLLGTYSREDIAAFVQEVLEDSIIQHIQTLQRSHPHKNIAVAGGVFANVKLNEHVVEQCGFARIFVQPAMGDDGLVLGAAFSYLKETNDAVRSRSLHDVYTGVGYENDAIKDLLKERGYAFRTSNSCAEEVAQMIVDGKIIGWFDGAMEFGPRALGHRSILADPRKKEVNDELNKRLKRSEFMPFAPSALTEYADEIFVGVEPGRHTAEFMTITFIVSEAWRDKVKAVVHVDHTARPQLVRKDRNAAYYAVIDAYRRKTGIPLVVNTSFNMHEEPIVSSPQDALRSFDIGAVDYLVFNNRFIVEHRNDKD